MFDKFKSTPFLPTPKGVGFPVKWGSDPKIPGLSQCNRDRGKHENHPFVSAFVSEKQRGHFLKSI
jgi:hypothetical protein